MHAPLTCKSARGPKAVHISGVNCMCVLYICCILSMRTTYGMWTASLCVELVCLMDSGCTISVRQSYAVWLQAYHSPTQRLQRQSVVRSSLMSTLLPSHHGTSYVGRWKTAAFRCSSIRLLWMVNGPQPVLCWPARRHRHPRNDIPNPHLSYHQAMPSHRLHRKVHLIIQLAACFSSSGCFFRPYMVILYDRCDRSSHVSVYLSIHSIFCPMQA